MDRETRTLSGTRQYFEGQRRRSDHMTQGIEKQIGPIPAIESELHLFKVGREMLGAESVPRSHDAPLEKGKGRFNRIGVNVSHDIDAGTVVNFLVVCPLGFPHGGIVRGGIIGENDFHVLTDILADVLRERSAFCVSGVEEAQIAVALTDSDHDFFVIVLCDVAPTAIHAANVGNVHLYLAIQHWLISLRHRVPDAVTEIPCGFVSANSERALNLASGHTLLRLTEKKSRSKPCSKWQVRVIENCSSGHGELVVAVFAVEQMLLGFQLHHGSPAPQAAGAFREAQARQKLAALGIGREHRVNVH